MVLTICRLSAATPLVGRPTPVSLALLCSLARLALLPCALPLGGDARTERMHAAARAWREGLCASRTHPHALCVPLISFRFPFAFLLSAFHLLLAVMAFIFSFGSHGLHAAARAWREDLCVSRTRPHALCVPLISFRLFKRLSPPLISFHFLLWQAWPSLISD